jgi:hypothetical protein
MLGLSWAINIVTLRNRVRTNAVAAAKTKVFWTLWECLRDRAELILPLADVVHSAARAA